MPLHLWQASDQGGIRCGKRIRVRGQMRVSVQRGVIGCRPRVRQASAINTANDPYWMMQLNMSGRKALILR